MQKEIKAGKKYKAEREMETNLNDPPFFKHFNVFQCTGTFGIDCARFRTQSNVSCPGLPSISTWKEHLGCGLGNILFFFFPEEVYLGVLYFYFRLGILRAGIGIIFFLPILNSDGLKKKKTP